MQSIVGYNGKLKPLARNLRNNGSKAEACLCIALKSKQLGVKFSRQIILGNFIADFYCKQLKLAIELTSYLIPRGDNRKNNPTKKLSKLQFLEILRV